MTSSTASAAAQATGLPPNVLNSSVCSGTALQHLGPDHQGGDREAVAHRLSHHHHVGLDPGGLEAPQVRPGPAVTRLYFVRYQQAARRPHPPGRFPQVAGRGREDAVGGEGRVDVHRGQATARRAPARRRRCGRRTVRPTRPLRAGRRHGTRRAREPWRRGRAALRRPTPPATGRAWPRSARGRRRRSRPRRARPVAARAIRQARSLASLPEFTSSTASSPGGSVTQSRSARVDDRLVQVAAVRGQQPLLLGDRPRDPGVTVADDGHVVVAVEVAPVVWVEEPHPLAADQVQRARSRTTASGAARAAGARAGRRSSARR